MQITDLQKRIIDSLSEEIFNQAVRCASEQHDPRPDADQMDEYIKERKENVQTLRQIRFQLEEIFSGAIL